MGPASAGHVSLLLTGSLREKLKLMLKTDTAPIEADGSVSTER